MGYTMDEMKEVQEAYIAEFWIAPFDEYINSVGISKLRIPRDNLQHQFPLREGESLDDLCLSVTFRKKLFPDLSLPSHFRGARVLYETIGEIVAL